MVGHPGKVSIQRESNETTDDINGSFSGSGSLAVVSDLFIHLYPRVLRGAAKPSGSSPKCGAKGSFRHWVVKLGEG